MNKKIRMCSRFLKMQLPLIFIASFLFSSCYTIKQGIVLIGYLSRSIPLEKSGDEEFIKLVYDIRSFAMEELGLSMSKNYTRYVKIDRDYLVAVISASYKDSFKRYEWRFPIVGSMPYKGFFNIDDANMEQLYLEEKGLDVWVRLVDAFSTLGWFRDPLYSYMKNYSPGRLADLIIHELVHATVFIKGQVEFNEELAEFIGTEGARLYIASRYGTDSKEYKELFIDEEDSNKFVIFIQGLISELEILYSSGLDRETKLKHKSEIISDAKERFAAEYDTRFSNDGYRFFSMFSINNAYLELFRLYHTDDNFYKNLCEHSGNDLPALITAAKKIKKKGNPREQLEKNLQL